MLIGAELWRKVCFCVCWCVQDTDTLWLDYHQNINDKSLNTLDTYVTQFPDIKVRTFQFLLSNYFQKSHFSGYLEYLFSLSWLEGPR